jgi:hypothetical protein
MRQSWLPWALTGVLLVAAAFGAGFLVAGNAEPPRASVVLPESETGLAEEVARLRAEREQLEKARDSARERAESLAAEVESLANARAELRVQRDEAIAEAESAKAARAELEQRIGELQDRIGDLQDRLAATRERARTAAAEADATRVAEPRVSQSACRALSEALPPEADLPAKRPAADAFKSIEPDAEQTRTLAEGVLAYECTDYRGAYRRWLPLAQAGFPRAQFHVGALFYEGRGVDRDHALAFAWLTLARDHEISAAASLLQAVRQELDDGTLARARRILDRAG